MMETDIRIGVDIPGAGEASAYLAAAEGGGIALFVGTTRRITGGRETDKLFYEAHDSMAHSECALLARKAAEKWPVLRVVIWHRTGLVPVGEASVIIGVATAHRGPAFEACRYLIDTLKEDVPIWKREHFTDGSTEWVEPGAC